MASSDYKGQDDVFVEKLEEIVLANIGNENFNVEELARTYGASRSQLHRKLKRIKGQSVSQFIRELRLREAMKMLRNDVASVSEIAFRVGFNSTSYFNTCFHERYGHPPGKVKHQTTFKAVNKLSVASVAEQSIDSHKRKALLKNPWIISVASISFLLAAFLTIKAFTSKKENIEQVSIAVLPLDHLSEDTSKEYLTAGIHDALIGELGTIKGLRVISRISTLQFKDKELPIRDIAKQLGADHLVEGSLIYKGDSIRMQLQLIDVFPEEKHIWAKDYHNSVNDILSVQNTAIQDIANSIEVTLGDERKQRFQLQQNTNPETYKAYLRGIYYLTKSNAEDFQKGLNYLHQAVEIDPADPLAYAGLAEGYALLGHGPDPMNAPWRRGKAAALKALDLDPKSAKAHSALAMIQLYYERDWKAAEQSFAIAEKLNPNLPYNHYHYSWYLILLGKWEEAVKEHQLAKQLDPLAPLITSDMGLLHLWMGNHKKAMEEVKEALEIDKEYAPAWRTLGDIYIAKGMPQEGISAIKKSIEINPAALYGLGIAYAKIGNKDKALEIASELRKGAVSSREAFGLTLIYAHLGDFDEAFKWLSKKPLDVFAPWLRVWNGPEDFRKEPRFKQFLKELNLPPLEPSAT
ncbi:helix-turn-helix domain-containing protein [Ulvibacterium marinum]|uniref:Helix-turn-helix domain-containing protein n=1 Tax=Ulvibacterium marinum TaxID=2419782 RepID=A0A3B0CDH4_9FLAO|nr:helix-turn-helix domain-containing protein [Ulvibacterium marinum]RKN83320.1 helix-turn-helix domain-containing protein [Ulvibacterium marinum]